MKYTTDHAMQHLSLQCCYTFRFMVTEVYSSEVETMKYYVSGADMPFNFNLVRENLKTCGGKCFQRNIDGWINAMPVGKWPNFVVWPSVLLILFLSIFVIYIFLFIWFSF